MLAWNEASHAVGEPAAGGVHGVVSAEACRRRRAVSAFDLVTAAGVCTAHTLQGL
jgi:hypothetical protein